MNNSTKLTPSEVLQKQKTRLRLKSNVLTETLENDLNYIQNNMGTIINNSVMEVVVSKSPSFVKSLLGRGKHPETGNFDRWGLVGDALDVVPAFIKGPKGWLVRFLVELAKKRIFKRK